MTYGITLWGNTYISNLNPIITLQKRVVRIITFSKFDDHSSPLFKNLNILKLVDLVFLNSALFMYDYHNGNLPATFSNNIFKQVTSVHNYNTRLASRNTYYIDKIRTNLAMANSVFDFRVLKHGMILMINIKLLANHLLRIKLRKI